MSTVLTGFSERPVTLLQQAPSCEASATAMGTPGGRAVCGARGYLFVSAGAMPVAGGVIPVAALVPIGIGGWYFTTQNPP